MLKPIVILVWPRHVLYPVCEWNLERFQKYFSSVWIAFSNHHIENQDYAGFLRTRLPFAHFVDVERTREGDWRSDAVNTVLNQITTDEPILFLEQDFLIRDETFFEKVFKDDLDFVYFKEAERIHPAFACVKRSLIDKTSRDFAPHPPGDHFIKFFQELPEGVNIETLGVKKKEDFIHLNGLTNNYMNFQYGDPFYSPINFLYFNWMNLQFPNQHPSFYKVEKDIEQIYGHTQHHTYLGKFFPEE